MAALVSPELNDAQRELFNILEEYFQRATGELYSAYSVRGPFDDQMRANAHKIGPRMPDALQWGVPRLMQYYRDSHWKLFKAAKEYGGLKLVLGGSSRFNKGHLLSVRKMLLYSDTVLIPDPVLPWLERDRSEERFKNSLFLRTVYQLLHLKPLVDADGMPYPPVIVFPSYEKSLEENDPVTQKSIFRLTMSAFAVALGRNFGEWSDFLGFVEGNQVSFLEAVEKANLFVAPGQEIGGSLSEAIAKYRADRAVWTSQEHQNLMRDKTDAQLVILAVLERLGPQFHLFENAYELSAQPMLCTKQQWHYYEKCVSLYDDRLLSEAAIQPSTLATLRSLDSTKLEWLGNVPIDAIVTLRQENENEDFRRRLDVFTKTLSDASLKNIDRVALEVSRGIASMISEHSKKARAIEGRFHRKFQRTAVESWLTFGASLLPFLAPFIPATAVNAVRLTQSYLWDKADERDEKKQLSRSLLGVLAEAHENSPD